MSPGDEGEQLRPGDVGTIIHVHPGGEAYVVEFATLDGDTVDIATVLPSQTRPVTSRDLTHARSGGDRCLSPVLIPYVIDNQTHRMAGVLNHGGP